MTRRTPLLALSAILLLAASCTVDPLATPDDDAPRPSGRSDSGSTLAPPEVEVEIETETETGLEALAEQCSLGDFPACDELFARSEVGSELESFASTCGGRIEAVGSACVSTLCPLDIFAGTSLQAPGTVSLVTERFETVDFVTLICSVGDDLYYFGEAKAPPNSSITLAAEESGGRYIARNPTGEAKGSFVYEVGPDVLLVERDDEMLLEQPTLRLG